jgi:hypothetical protein
MQTYNSYLRFTTNELRNHLHKKKMPLATIEYTIEAVEKIKHEERVRKSSEFQQRTQWREIIHPLKYELKNAGSGLRYGERFPQFDCEERRLAFNAYITLLNMLVGKLVLYSKQGKTPAQLAKQKTKSFPNGLPNDGVHWSDWIPVTNKMAVSALFDDIPHKAKAKRKIPFERKLPPIPTDKKSPRQRLITRTSKELDIEERHQAIEHTDERAHRIKQMKEALRILASLTDNDAVPRTWHGYFKGQGEVRPVSSRN